MRVGVAVAVVAVLFGGLAVAEHIVARPVELPAPAAGEMRAEWLPDGTPVFVTRRGDDVAVVDARSPHWLDEGLGVYLAACANTHVIWEPWYASMYDYAGRWLGGPAPGGLASYDAELDGDNVRVGERRPAPARSTGDEHVPPGECAWLWQHPDTVHHYAGALTRAETPEAVAESSRRQPTLVLAAVERVGVDARRACSWQPTPTVQGPLCDDTAAAVEPSPFGFLSERIDDEWGDQIVGSYGLYLMTNDRGRLQVRGVIPQQIEYDGDSPRASGVAVQE